MLPPGKAPHLSLTSGYHTSKAIALTAGLLSAEFINGMSSDAPADAPPLYSLLDPPSLILVTRALDTPFAVMWKFFSHSD